MKKILLVSLAFLALGFVPHAFAQDFVPLVRIEGLTNIPTSEGFAVFFNNLYKYAIGAAAIIAVIEIIAGGLQISTQESVSAHGAGKERIFQAIFGLVLVLSPVLVFTIINPRILNLSLNMPVLDTQTQTFRRGEDPGGTNLSRPAPLPLNSAGGGERAGGGFSVLFPCTPGCDAARAMCLADMSDPNTGAPARMGEVCALNGTDVACGTPGSTIMIKCTSP